MATVEATTRSDLLVLRADTRPWIPPTALTTLVDALSETVRLAARVAVVRDRALGDARLPWEEYPASRRAHRSSEGEITASPLAHVDSALRIGRLSYRNPLEIVWLWEFEHLRNFGLGAAGLVSFVALVSAEVRGWLDFAFVRKRPDTPSQEASLQRAVLPDARSRLAGAGFPHMQVEQQAELQASRLVVIRKWTREPPDVGVE